MGEGVHGRLDIEGPHALDERDVGVDGDEVEAHENKEHAEKDDGPFAAASFLCPCSPGGQDDCFFFLLFHSAPILAEKHRRFKRQNVKDT